MEWGLVRVALERQFSNLILAETGRRRCDGVTDRCDGCQEAPGLEKRETRGTPRFRHSAMDLGHPTDGDACSLRKRSLRERL
jgi:hypothetical protein